VLFLGSRLRAHSIGEAAHDRSTTGVDRTRRHERRLVSGRRSHRRSSCRRVPEEISATFRRDATRPAHHHGRLEEHDRNVVGLKGELGRYSERFAIFHPPVPAWIFVAPTRFASRTEKNNRLRALPPGRTRAVQQFQGV
jgi:hypothetical protein